MRALYGLLLGGILALVASCATTDLSPEKQVYALQLQYDAVLEQLEAYAAQPACDAEAGIFVGCYEPEVLDKAVEIADEVDMHLDAAEVTVRAGEGDASSAISAARAALRELSRQLAEDAT